jgi:uncharacterized membrane protein (DUF373 family)
MLLCDCNKGGEIMKLRFKKWVMVAFSILIVVGLFKVLSIFTESEVNKCMDYGYTETYCRRAG